MNETELTEEAVINKIENSERVFVDFWAPWCRPCLMTKPFVEQIKEERKDILVLQLDVEKNPDLARNYNVTSIPTFMYFEKGKFISEKIGVMSKKDMINMIDKII